MLFDFITSTISSFLDFIISKIPDISNFIPLDDFIDSFIYLFNLSQSLNVILPLKESLLFLSILLSVKLSLLLFWAAMRAINLIRGAG